MFSFFLSYYSHQLDTIGYNDFMKFVDNLVTKHKTVIYLLLGNLYLLFANLLDDYNTILYSTGLILLVAGLASLKPKKVKTSSSLVQKPFDFEYKKLESESEEELHWHDIALTGWWAAVIILEVAIIVFYFFVVQNFLNGNHGWNMFYVWKS